MSNDFQELGKKVVQQGGAACLLLAGGQGTRLGHSGPKGTFPLIPETGLTLFQLFAEKIGAASLWAQRPLCACIMTSEENDSATRAFFEAHDFFGLREDLSFVVQESLPFLDVSGRPLAQSGPAGNGWALRHLIDGGVAQAWEKQGVQAITVIPVDNPLADPFDCEIIGAVAAGAPLAMKCSDRVAEEEKVGVVVQEGGKTRVVEYSELSDEQKWGRESNGKLRYPIAHLGLFCFSLTFVHEAARRAEELPIHLALKPCKTTRGEIVAYKQERYLFDCLPFASHVAIIYAAREHCFAPLKDRNSLPHVQAALRRSFCWPEPIDQQVAPVGSAEAGESKGNFIAVP
jgi:UDP-N-acetylglucosamine/UDP-N-acetylgalactosamine diphosphorylase